MLAPAKRVTSNLKYIQINVILSTHHPEVKGTTSSGRTPQRNLTQRRIANTYPWLSFSILKELHVCYLTNYMRHNRGKIPQRTRHLNHQWSHHRVDLALQVEKPTRNLQHSSKMKTPQNWHSTLLHTAEATDSFNYRYSTHLHRVRREKDNPWTYPAVNETTSHSKWGPQAHLNKYQSKNLEEPKREPWESHGHTLSFCQLHWMRATGRRRDKHVSPALRVRYLSHALDLLLPATSCHTGYCWRTLGGSSGRSSSLQDRPVCLYRDGSGWTFGPLSSSLLAQLSLWAPLQLPCVHITNTFINDKRKTQQYRKQSTLFSSHDHTRFIQKQWNDISLFNTWSKHYSTCNFSSRKLHNKS